MRGHILSWHLSTGRLFIYLRPTETDVWNACLNSTISMSASGTCKSYFYLNSIAGLSFVCCARRMFPSRITSVQKLDEFHEALLLSNRNYSSSQVKCLTDRWNSNELSQILVTLPVISVEAETMMNDMDLEMSTFECLAIPQPSTLPPSIYVPPMTTERPIVTSTPASSSTNMTPILPPSTTSAPEGALEIEHVDLAVFLFGIIREISFGLCIILVGTVVLTLSFCKRSERSACIHDEGVEMR